jgi:hypothetical protein
MIYIPRNAVYEEEEIKDTEIILPGEFYEREDRKKGSSSDRSSFSFLTCGLGSQSRQEERRQL